MKKEDLEKQVSEKITAVLPEGTKVDFSKVDFEGLNTFVNNDTNNIVASKKAGFIEEGKTSFLTEKGFKDVAAFDTFKTNSESSETDLQKKFNKLEGEHNTLTSKHTKLNVEIVTDKEIGRLKSSEKDGFRVDPQYAKFVHSEFAGARNAAKTSGKELTMEEWASPYFEKNSQYQLSVSTGTRSRGPKINSGDDRKEFYDKRYGDRGKKK